MPDLKRQLIKLGSTNPELRPHIREVLKKASSQKSAMKFGPQTLGGTLEDMNDKIAMGLRSHHWIDDSKVVAIKHDTKVTADLILATIQIRGLGVVGGGASQELKIVLKVSIKDLSITGKVGNKNIFPIKIKPNVSFDTIGKALWESVLEAVEGQF